MLIVINLKTLSKWFLELNSHMSALKWGQRSSSAIIGAFLQTVFLFFSGPTTRLTCLLLKEPLWKHPFMDFTKTNIVSFVQL